MQEMDADVLRQCRGATFGREFSRPLRHGSEGYRFGSFHSSTHYMAFASVDCIIRSRSRHQSAPDSSLRAIDLAQDMTGPVPILIGPEGGWSRAAVQYSRAGESRTHYLGRQILRVETAAIATISILQSRLDKVG